MAVMERWAELLSKRVVAICEERGVQESDCERLVDCWIQKVPEGQRPTTVSVLMKAKRKLWNLVEI